MEVVPSPTPAPPFPVITMAGWGLSPVTFSASGGGTITLAADITGGERPYVVELRQTVTDPLLGAAEVVLIELTDSDEDGRYEVVFSDLPPDILPPGEFTLPGLRILVTDALGQEASWPALNVQP